MCHNFNPTLDKQNSSTNWTNAKVVKISVILPALLMLEPNACAWCLYFFSKNILLANK